MKYLELTFAEPAENLACDEVLLDALESGTGDEVLRFWESRRYFVVLGYGNRVGTEVNRSACEARRVPILRRCTGGGTVLQGPGCFNYALVLRTDRPGLQSIPSANRMIMEQNRAVLEPLLESIVRVRGCTDLAMGEVKFSGNAQRRRRNALLFHGSFLLSMDLMLLSELLPLPSKQPDYRKHRRHEDFLTNIALPAESIREALKKAWDARDELNRFPQTAVVSLARDKYATDAWNLRF